MRPTVVAATSLVLYAFPKSRCILEPIRERNINDSDFGDHRRLCTKSIPMPSRFDLNAAERFAALTLACVHKEYPNKLSHSLNSDAEVAPPRKLTPAFNGC